MEHDYLELTKSFFEGSEESLFEAEVKNRKKRIKYSDLISMIKKATNMDEEEIQNMFIEFECEIDKEKDEQYRITKVKNSDKKTITITLGN